MVIILQGRFAGKKAVIVQAYDDGHGDRKFGHAVGEWMARLEWWAHRRCGGGHSACFRGASSSRCARLTSGSPAGPPPLFSALLFAVAGVDRSPKKVTRDMSKKQFNKKTSVKPFVKFVNYNHVMPTRYTLDVADKIKALLGDDTLTNEEKRKTALKTLKTTLDERCVGRSRCRVPRCGTGHNRLCCPDTGGAALAARPMQIIVLHGGAPLGASSSSG